MDESRLKLRRTLLWCCSWFGVLWVVMGMMFGVAADAVIGLGFTVLPLCALAFGRFWSSRWSYVAGGWMGFVLLAAFVSFEIRYCRECNRLDAFMLTTAAAGVVLLQYWILVAGDAPAVCSGVWPVALRHAKLRDSSFYVASLSPIAAIAMSLAGVSPEAWWMYLAGLGISLFLLAVRAWWVIRQRPYCIVRDFL